MGRSEILLVLLLGLGATVGAFYFAPVRDIFFGADFDADTPQVTVQVAFDGANETVRLTHDGGDELNEGSQVRVTVCPAETATPVNATLAHRGTVVENGMWISGERPAAAPYPLGIGDSVRVLGDGVDSDDDGTAGIEPGDTLVVEVVMTRTGAKRVFLNETVGNETASACPSD